MSLPQYRHLDMEGDDIDLETSSEKSDYDDEYDPLEAILIYQNICARSQGLSLTEKGKGGMWALALQSLGAALRLLAPAALLTIFCGQDSLIIRLLHHCDRAVRGVLFPTPDQTNGVLQWLQSSLPGDKRTKTLDAVWADGSVLCDLVESVVPGSCQGHAGEERVDLGHGQRLAEQYLGVTPIFSERELSQKTLSTYQECRLTHYLDCVKDAVSRLSPPVSRTGTPLLNVQAYTLDYVARGMGLVTASRNRRSTFYIYPTAQQGLDPGDISVQIKGPGNCYGTTVIPVIYGRTHIIRNVFLNLGQNANYMHLPLPMAQGSSYLRNYNKTDVEKNYFVPKIKNDIEVKIVVRHDRVKVNYVPLVAGNHELSLISKGCHIIGSPFTIDVDIGSKERQNSVDYLDEDVVTENQNRPERKIVFRIVDFVTEKMLLTEDGKLEKISDSDAEKLLHTAESLDDMTLKYLQYTNRTLPGPDLIEYNNNSRDGCQEHKNEFKIKKTFNIMAREVIVMLRVCRKFKNCKNILKEKNISLENNTSLKKLGVTPDVVNSTINESPFNSFSKSSEETKLGADNLRDQFKKKVSSFNLTVDEENEIELTTENKQTHSKILTSDQIPGSGNNYDSENDSDDLSYTGKRRVYPRMASIEIVISSIDEDDGDPLDNLIPSKILPILEELPERPKTPVFKILATNDSEETGNVYNEFEHYELEKQIFDSLDEYVDNYCPETDKALNTNFIDIKESVDERCVSPSINFHIGAPVTPTRMMNAPSIDLDMDSIILATNLEEALNKYDMKLQKNMNDNENSDDGNCSIFTTPNLLTPFEEMTDSQILKMYEDEVPAELDDNSTKTKDTLKIEQFDKDKISLNHLNNQKCDTGESQSLKNIKVPVIQNLESFSSFMQNDEGFSLNEDSRHHSIETWDSAYISIDEINSSPDTNSNSPRSDSSPRGKLFAIIENENESPVFKNNYGKTLTKKDFDKMGPAEKEIWKNITHEKMIENKFNYGSNKCDEVPSKPFEKIVHDKNAIESTDENEDRLLKFGETCADKNNPFFYKTGELLKTNGPIFLHHKNYNDARFEKISLNNSCDKLFLKKDTWRHHKQKHKTTNTLDTERKLKVITNDGSASDINADVKRSGNDNHSKFVHNTTENGNYLVENIDESKKRVEEPLVNCFKSKSTDTLSQQFEHDISPVHENKLTAENEKSSVKMLSKMVSERKEYWDEMIKTLENNDEKRYRSPRKRSTLKKNDSLSKKRGKQTIAKMPSITEKWKQSFEPKIHRKNETFKILPYPSPNSLVARWKNYWNDMVERANSPETDTKSKQKHNAENSLKNIKVPDLKSSPKKAFGKIEYEFNSTNNIHESKNDYVKKTNKSCGATFLDKEKVLNSPSSKDSEKKVIQSDINLQKYHPKPINLNKLSERIETFLDSLPSSTPVTDLEKSRFSTPELPFGGLVSHKISSYPQKRNFQEDNINILKLVKNDDRLTVTWNGNSTDRRIKAFQDISNAPTPEVQMTTENPNIINTSVCQKGDLENEKSVMNESKDIDMSEYTTPEPFEKVFDKDDFTDFPAISEIKARIQCNEKNAKSKLARESFLKKAQTIDIPKTHSIEKLKRYFSVESLDNDVDRKNFYQPLQRNKVLSKGQSLKNINSDDSDKRSALLSEKSISIESFPTISERKARIEKHLQSVQQRMNEKQNEMSSSDEDKTSIVADEIVRTEDSQYDQESKNPEGEKIASYSVEKYVYEKEIKTVKKKKPVGAIVAAFESWAVQPLRDAKRIEGKQRTLQENETANEILNNKKNIDSTKISIIDAKNGEGTRRKYINTSSKAINKEIEQDNVADVKTSYKNIFTNENSSKSKTCIVNEKNYNSDVQQQEQDTVYCLKKDEEQFESIKCKERFRKAKLFFQNRDVTKNSSLESNSANINECEKMLLGLTDTKKENAMNKDYEESINYKTKKKNEFINIRDCKSKQSNERPIRRNFKKCPIKSFSAPTSDAESDYHNFERTRGGSCKLKKISEKFLVDDLFQDVAGESNKTSVGVFKGIPHKNAVLAAFRSMENVTQTTSYEYTVSQMEDFAKKNGIVNSQTYHSEYPHLPTTQPGKYRARQDFVASGLILRKDLLKVNKARRNSAPDACHMKLSFVTHI